MDDKKIKKERKKRMMNTHHVDGSGMMFSTLLLVRLQCVDVIDLHLLMMRARQDLKANESMIITYIHMYR
jgi:hypothetical protein